MGSAARKLPRTPSVFERKTRWRFPEFEGDPIGDWQRNYPSISEHAALVTKLFEAEESEGLMCRMLLRDAMELYGEDLMIAATGGFSSTTSFPPHRLSPFCNRPVNNARWPPAESP